MNKMMRNKGVAIEPPVAKTTNPGHRFLTKLMLAKTQAPASGIFSVLHP